MRRVPAFVVVTLVALATANHCVQALVAPSSSTIRFAHQNGAFVGRTINSSFRTSRTTRLFYRQSDVEVERDFYAILGVPRTATDDEIKRAYRKLAKLYHPDANPDRDTTEQFKMLNRAYEVLRDPVLKKSYDAFGQKGIGTSAASDIDNMSRVKTQARKASGTHRRNSAGTSSYSTTDFSNGWPSGGGASRSTRPKNGRTVNINVDPFQSTTSNARMGSSTGAKADPSTFGSDGYSWPNNDAARAQHFRKQKAAKSTTFTSPETSGPKANDSKAYYGDMGSVHTQGFHQQANADSHQQEDVFMSGNGFFGRGPKFGKDVLVDVDLDTKIANDGGFQVVEVKHMVACTACHGTGAKENSQVSACRHCGGSGHTIGPSQIREECMACGGTGRAIHNPCGTCEGTGLEAITHKLNVTIPRGIDDGYTMRIPGEGDAGPQGGPSGDLYICFQIGEQAKKKYRPSNQAKPKTKRASPNPTAAKKKPKIRMNGGINPTTKQQEKQPQTQRRVAAPVNAGRPTTSRTVTPPNPGRRQQQQRVASTSGSRPQQRVAPNSMSQQQRMNTNSRPPQQRVAANNRPPQQRMAAKNRPPQQRMAANNRPPQQRVAANNRRPQQRVAANNMPRQQQRVVAVNSRPQTQKQQVVANARARQQRVAGNGRRRQQQQTMMSNGPRHTMAANYGGPGPQRAPRKRSAGLKPDNNYSMSGFTVPKKPSQGLKPDNNYSTSGFAAASTAAKASRASAQSTPTVPYDVAAATTFKPRTNMGAAPTAASKAATRETVTANRRDTKRSRLGGFLGGLFNRKS